MFIHDPLSCQNQSNDYAEKVFFPHMLEKLEYVDRLDVIWDRYLPKSLKQATRLKRGSSCRIQVKECTDVLETGTK